MKQLPAIFNQGPQLLADSRAIARFFEMEHESLRKLIVQNLAAFETFGAVRFEIGARQDGNKGGVQPKFCHLNEAQVGFLLTLTRNNKRTTELKLALIQQFQRVRQTLRPVDTALLSVPDQWRKIFPDSFYSALLKLYGDVFKRSEGTPSWVGAWTNKYIYEPLWAGLSDELKIKRKASAAESDAEFLKLHQFLEANAKAAVEKHIMEITMLLKVSASKEAFKENYASYFGGSTQILMTSLLGRAA